MENVVTEPFAAMVTTIATSYATTQRPHVATLSHENINIIAIILALVVDPLVGWSTALVPELDMTTHANWT